MPSDIAVDSISDYRIGELNRLRAWLHQQRSKVRIEKERGEQRQKREEDETRREAEQPALFQF